jgi:hypothetical protein
MGCQRREEKEEKFPEFDEIHPFTHPRNSTNSRLYK